MTDDWRLGTHDSRPACRRGCHGPLPGRRGFLPHVAGAPQGRRCARN